jgi:hypothetical protein
MTWIPGADSGGGETMRILIATAAALALSGCATNEPMQVAQAECKIHPVTTTSVTDTRKPQTEETRQRMAEMELATSSYRFRNLQQNAYNMNNVEDALRDCQGNSR